MRTPEPTPPEDYYHFPPSINPQEIRDASNISSVPDRPADAEASPEEQLAEMISPGSRREPDAASPAEESSGEPGVDPRRLRALWLASALLRRSPSPANPTAAHTGGSGSSGHGGTPPSTPVPGPGPAPAPPSFDEVMRNLVNDAVDGHTWGKLKPLNSVGAPYVNATLPRGHRPGHRPYVHEVKVQDVHGPGVAPNTREAVDIYRTQYPSPTERIARALDAAVRPRKLLALGAAAFTGWLRRSGRP